LKKPLFFSLQRKTSSLKHDKNAKMYAYSKNDRQAKIILYIAPRCVDFACPWGYDEVERIPTYPIKYSTSGGQA
jgi:hypothetical protein